MKILRLEFNMKSQAEFTSKKLVILKDLTLKGWVKRCRTEEYTTMTLTGEKQ